MRSSNVARARLAPGVLPGAAACSSVGGKEHCRSCSIVHGVAALHLELRVCVVQCGRWVAAAPVWFRGE